MSGVDTAAPELEIEIEDDLPEVLEAPEAGAGGQEAAKPAGKVAETAPEQVDGVEDLRQKLAEEQKQRQAADARAKHHEEQAQKAQREAETGRTSVFDAQLGQLQNAAARLKTQSEGLKRDFADAMRAGDYDKAGEIQEKIGETAAHRQAIEAGRQQLEARKAAAPKAAPTAPAAPADPVEALATRLTPKSADWVRAHPEYASGWRYGQMVDAHEAALRDGKTADTDAYFAHVEESLGLKAKEAPRPKTQTPVAAPANRAVAPGSASPTRVRLTAEEVQMAKDMNLTKEEYAKAKLDFERKQRAKA